MYKKNYSTKEKFFAVKEYVEQEFNLKLFENTFLFMNNNTFNISKFEYNNVYSHISYFKIKKNEIIYFFILDFSFDFPSFEPFIDEDITSYNNYEYKIASVLKKEKESIDKSNFNVVVFSSEMEIILITKYFNLNMFNFRKEQDIINFFDFSNKKNEIKAESIRKEIFFKNI